MSFYASLSTKIYLMEKHIKENNGKTKPQPFVVSAIEPWYLSAAWRTETIGHLKLGFYKILLALVRLGLILRGRPASNFTVFTRAGKEGLYICNYSYCYYKGFHNKTRNKTIATIVAATILLSLVISLIFPGYPGVKAATYNFSQTSWIGGESALTASHTTDQSTWTKYSAKDADLTAGVTLTLGGTSNSGSTFLDTTDADFGAGNYGTPAVTRSDGAGGVILVLPPAQVTGLSPTAGNTQVVLNWTAPANGGSAITSYKVYRGTSSGGESLLSSGGCSGLGSVLTCTDTGLTNGTTYYYKVSAVNAIGEGSQSAEVSATPTACGATTSVTYGAKTYNTVGIGTQCWMATNLEYDNGCTAITWVNYTDVGWCGYYTGGPFTNEGLLYQWSVATSICPSGWHLPTDAEFKTLVEGQATAGCESSTGWQCSPAGTNLKTGGSSGFEGVLAGARYTNGTFYFRGSYAYLWSSTQYNASNSWDRLLYSGLATVYRYDDDKAYGFSVRCLKD